MKSKKTKSHLLPFSLGMASAGMSYALTTQLSYCLTDSYGLSAALVGMIFLVSRIFDGISDIIAGFIIDRTHTKWGKARPFDLFCIPLWIILILCFSVPSFQTFGKILWVFLTYNLCQTVCYTFVTVSQTVRVKRSFEPDMRAKVLSFGGVLAAIMSTAVGIVTPSLIAKYESHPHGWTIIIAMFAIPGIIMTLLQFFLVPEINNEEELVEPVSIKESVKILFSNRYIFIVAGAIIMLSMVNTLITTSGTFYFKYVYGDLSALSLVNLTAVIGFLLMLIIPTLTKKFGNRNTMIIAFVIMAAFNILKYFFKVNMIGLALCGAVAGAGLTIGNTLRDLLVIDCITYGQEKNGSNLEGIYASVKGFADKIALGLGSMLSGLILQLGHYNGNLNVQPASAQTAITFCYAGLPAILSIVGILLMLKYNLKQK